MSVIYCITTELSNENIRGKLLMNPDVNYRTLNIFFMAIAITKTIFKEQKDSVNLKKKTFKVTQIDS